MVSWGITERDSTHQTSHKDWKICTSMVTFRARLFNSFICIDTVMVSLSATLSLRTSFLMPKAMLSWQTLVSARSLLTEETRNLFTWWHIPDKRNYLFGLVRVLEATGHRPVEEENWLLTKLTVL